ncbi:hypothetical protein DC522_32355 [Microvirga sp. KLBC 81]|nr:hypothetical protein DC522_32355 [Microvirga sp. KLBC 81]
MKIELEREPMKLQRPRYLSGSAGECWRTGAPAVVFRRADAITAIKRTMAAPMMARAPARMPADRARNGPDGHRRAAVRMPEQVARTP